MLIAHLTSAHSRSDTRIFYKMCSSLATQGYDVNLVVADGKGDEFKSGVRIFDVGASKNRMDRIFNVPKRVLARAVTLKADIYHLHYPELIPIGIKLLELGRRVIFDSHEDVPKQILGKPYLSKLALWGLSKAFSFYEAWTCAKLSGVVAATPAIHEKFLAINPNSIDINNFPLLDELHSLSSWADKQPSVCYVGGISEIRGILEVTQAMALVESGARLKLVGQFEDVSLKRRVQQLPGSQKIDILGVTDRIGVRNLMADCMAGIVTFHPAPNHLAAQPNKMLEYMSAGIPVIASDFPLWRKIIEGNDCGLLVDPLNSAQIADAIEYLVKNPEEAQRFGRNGRDAVLKSYNWPGEEQKLFRFYERILGLSCSFN